MSDCVIGTTGTKGIYDAADVLKGKALKGSVLHSPKPGWVEQDPADIYGSALGTLQSALNRSGIAPVTLSPGPDGPDGRGPDCRCGSERADARRSTARQPVRGEAERAIGFFDDVGATAQRLSRPIGEAVLPWQDDRARNNAYAASYADFIGDMAVLFHRLASVEV